MFSMNPNIFLAPEDVIPNESCIEVAHGDLVGRSVANDQETFGVMRHMAWLGACVFHSQEVSQFFSAERKNARAFIAIIVVSVVI